MAAFDDFFMASQTDGNRVEHSLPVPLLIPTITPEVRLEVRKRSHDRIGNPLSARSRVARGGLAYPVLRTDEHSHPVFLCERDQIGDQTTYIRRATPGSARRHEYLRSVSIDQVDDDSAAPGSMARRASPPASGEVHELRTVEDRAADVPNTGVNRENPW